MKPLIAILIVVGLIFGVWKVWDYWEQVNKEKAQVQEELANIENSSSYDGMPSQLQESFRKAEAKGPTAVKQWLDTYRHLVKDPRLAAIELDYVVSISREDPVTAKKMFADIKERIQPTSPLYKRIQALEKNYE